MEEGWESQISAQGKRHGFPYSSVRKSRMKETRVLFRSQLKTPRAALDPTLIVSKRCDSRSYSCH